MYYKKKTRSFIAYRLIDPCRNTKIKKDKHLNKNRRHNTKALNIPGKVSFLKYIPE